MSGAILGYTRLQFGHMTWESQREFSNSHPHLQMTIHFPPIVVLSFYRKKTVGTIPPFFRNAYMSPALKAHFIELKKQRDSAQTELAAQQKQNQTFIIDTDGVTISSLELVNFLPNGKIQTVNSMKYHSRTIKKQLHILFKYHYLRHTYGTTLADMNTPAHILRNQMGHASINVTQRYYIAVSQSGIDILKKNLGRI